MSCRRRIKAGELIAAALGFVADAAVPRSMVEVGETDVRYPAPFVNWLLFVTGVTVQLMIVPLVVHQSPFVRVLECQLGNVNGDGRRSRTRSIARQGDALVAS